MRIGTSLYRADINDDFGWQSPTNLGGNVNTAAAENGNGYFDNGGDPQLFFGSDRLGPAGSADLYVSSLQADGSWGPAARIPELSSTGTENRPTIRQDGLEIFFYSDRGGGAGGSDLWTATRTTVDAAWSTPVNLRHHHHRQVALAPQRIDEVQHLAAQRRAEGGEGLVEQQQRPVAHQAAGERDALALAAGELRRQPRLQARQPDLLQARAATRARAAASSRRPGSMPRPTFARRVRWAKRLCSWNSDGHRPRRRRQAGDIRRRRSGSGRSPASRSRR